MPGAEGTIGAYVNPHGVIHQTLTVRQVECAVLCCAVLCCAVPYVGTNVMMSHMVHGVRACVCGYIIMSCISSDCRC